LFRDDAEQGVPARRRAGRRELAIVVRTPHGGVAWQIWPIAAH
jgi:hypothetical protein